ncbi:D-alanine--D-alanine ligase [Pilimelia terevasa]|uniref:D-alanine--D-alanine ligase n=1 Tax=Pilimelia terevasa TaxID=53372 RepID=A0A8J3BQU5_9ACTN|nr:D-alanine--D-alanine ligase family protein [Pilimelia terevasa]GGK28436.1 D-alanine--D-alanine ligase [Pilimelia terevasa]
MSQDRIRVAVVFGGRSTEHAISCVSAGGILAALDPAEFDVLPVGIARDGRWVLPADTAPLAIVDRRLPEVTADSGPALVLPGDPAHGPLRLEPADRPGVVAPARGFAALGGVDVVFPVLHGAYGEDGTVQGLLELAGLPYVGSGVLASAAAMDKEFTKRLAQQAGIPVGPYAVLRPGTATLDGPTRQRLGLPVFVKPCRAGSSHGISRVADWADLDAAVAHARAVDPKVIVEAGIAGREVECGVLEGESGGVPEASPLAEVRVVAGHDFYDFEAKYLDDSCEYDVPARLGAAVTARVQELARTAFTALDCAGLARVDFFVTDAGEVLLNEVNTMPGFTPTSMFPRMWAAAGLEYPKLVARLVHTALARGTGLR